MADLTLETLYRFYEQLWRIRLLEGHVQRLAAAGESLSLKPEGPSTCVKYQPTPPSRKGLRIPPGAR